MIIFTPAIALGMLLVGSTGTSIAASFDCAKAHTSMERAICASPRLSELDAQMANSYKRALRALSPDGVQELKKSQRGWLDFVGRACAVTDEAESTAREHREVCLTNEISRRVGQLDQVGIRVGAYVLNRIDRFEVVAATPDDQNGSYPGMTVHRIAYPQIDAADSSSAVDWNAGEVRTFPELDGEDFEIDYAVGCVGQRVLSIGWHTSEYGHGAAHGTDAGEIRNVVLPTLSDMAPDDLFAAESHWRDRLPQLFWEAYLHGDRVIRDRPEIERAIREAAVDPGKWLLTPRGLQISFDSYEAGCYACNPGPLTVSWTPLKPLLTSPELAFCRAPGDVRR